MTHNVSFGSVLTDINEVLKRIEYIIDGFFVFPNDKTCVLKLLKDKKICHDNDIFQNMDIFQGMEKFQDMEGIVLSSVENPVEIQDAESSRRWIFHNLEAQHHTHYIVKP